MEYWWLWVFEAVLVSAGFLFYLATQYGTWEFFGRACLRALLPLIPVMVLVGGGGSTVFALTKVLIEKRGLKRPAALALLVAPALLVTAPLVLLGVYKSPAHRLSYICAGQAPAAVSQVRITGYSTFLREEWLAVFQVGPTNFQQLVEQAKLAPADSFEFGKVLDRSSLKTTKAFQALPQADGLHCFKRVFSARDEHKLGSVYATFDPATSTAFVLREYHE
jgi:hypothetical protein